MAKRILLVEDDVFLSELYSDLLIQNGFDTTTAKDGESAIKDISQEDWDLILLDLILPDMNGLEVLDRVGKQKTQFIAKKIVILSNKDDNQQDTEKLRGRFGGYLIKSKLSPEDFITQVKNHLKEN